MKNKMIIDIGINTDYPTQKTTLKLRRKCGEALRYFSNEFNYVEFKGLGVGYYQFRTWREISMDDLLFIVDYAVKNTSEFAVLIGNYSKEEKVIELAKIEPKMCFFTGEFTREYRTTGENTY